MFFTSKPALILLTSLFIINLAHADDAITIENAWSPEAPPVVKVMAGYMKIKNNSNKDINISGIKSSLFNRVEIHLTKTKNGMMKMVKQDNLTIKANSTVELKPGGLHMMLMGKQKPIQAGSIIPVTISFDNGVKKNIKLTVKNDEEPQMKCGPSMHH